MEITKTDEYTLAIAETTTTSYKRDEVVKQIAQVEKQIDMMTLGMRTRLAKLQSVLAEMDKQQIISKPISINEEIK